MMTNEYWEWCGECPAEARAIAVPLIDLELELICRLRFGLGVGEPATGEILNLTGDELEDAYYSMDPVSTLSGWEGPAAELFGDRMDLVYVALREVALIDRSLATAIGEQSCLVNYAREKLFRIAAHLVRTRRVVSEIQYELPVGVAAGVGDVMTQQAVAAAEASRRLLMGELESVTSVAEGEMRDWSEHFECTLLELDEAAAACALPEQADGLLPTGGLKVDLGVLAAKEGKLLQVQGAVLGPSRVGPQILAEVRLTHGVGVLPEFYSSLAWLLEVRASLLARLSNDLLAAHANVAETVGRYAASDTAGADAVMSLAKIS